MSCHSLVACRVSAERSALNLMGIPLYVVWFFSHAAFNIFSLYLIFDSLINVSWRVSSWIYPVWDSLWFLDWLPISFPMLSEFSTINSSNIFSDPFFFSCSSGNVHAFNVIPEVSKTVLNSFHSFFFILLCSS